MLEETTETQPQAPETNIQNDQPSTPHTALKRLERLVGTWNASDPSGAEAIHGQVTFQWMEGGNFLLQHVDFGDSKGIEIIGYNAESNSLTSHYFDVSGKILEYTYELHDDTLTVSIDMPRAKGQFSATFSDDDTYTGRWDWTQDGVKMGYDATMIKSK